ARADLDRELFADRGREALRVVDALDGHALGQDHRRGEDGSGEGPAAGLVDAGQQFEAAVPETPLEGEELVEPAPLAPAGRAAACAPHAPPYGPQPSRFSRIRAALPRSRRR